MQIADRGDWKAPCSDMKTGFSVIFFLFGSRCGGEMTQQFPEAAAMSPCSYLPWNALNIITSERGDKTGLWNDTNYLCEQVWHDSKARLRRIVFKSFSELFCNELKRLPYCESISQRPLHHKASVHSRLLHSWAPRRTENNKNRAETPAMAPGWNGAASGAETRGSAGVKTRRHELFCSIVTVLNLFGWNAAKRRAEQRSRAKTGGRIRFNLGKSICVNFCKRWYQTSPMPQIKQLTEFSHRQSASRTAWAEAATSSLLSQELSQSLLPIFFKKNG